MIKISTGPGNRSDGRIMLGFKALFYTNSIEGNAVVSNLSRSGAFLVTRANLRVGHALRLIVLLGNGSRQEFSGDVVRRNQSGVGIRFEDGCEEAGRLVHNINAIVNTRLVAEAIADLPPIAWTERERLSIPATA